MFAIWACKGVRDSICILRTGVTATEETHTSLIETELNKNICIRSALLRILNSKGLIETFQMAQDAGGTPVPTL